MSSPLSWFFKGSYHAMTVKIASIDEAGFGVFCTNLKNMSPAVSRLRLDPTLHEVNITFDPRAVRSEEILRQIQSMGHPAEVVEPARDFAQLSLPRVALFLFLVLGLLIVFFTFFI